MHFSPLSLSPCSGLVASNGGLWQSLVVVGGGGGGLGFWVRVWREREREVRNAYFYAVGRIYNL